MMLLFVCVFCYCSIALSATFSFFTPSSVLLLCITELRYLHSVSGDHDSAVKVMMRNPVDAWDNVIFKEEITQVTNAELYFQVFSPFFSLYFSFGMKVNYDVMLSLLFSVL